jgi:hypothetical protein
VFGISCYNQTNPRLLSIGSCLNLSHVVNQQLLDVICSIPLMLDGS